MLCTLFATPVGEWVVMRVVFCFLLGGAWGSVATALVVAAAVAM